MQKRCFNVSSNHTGSSISTVMPTLAVCILWSKTEEFNSIIACVLENQGS